MAREVLREIEAIGLIDSSEEGVRLAPDLNAKPMDYPQWLAWLIPWMCDRIVDPLRAEQCRQLGVPSALAWLLCQDARRPVRYSGAHAELLNQQVGGVDGLGFNLGNDATFQNLVYWARYLGFAETFEFPSSSTAFVIADPSRAIRRVLPQVFSETPDLAIVPFTERLAAALPVLEEGSARRTVEQRLAPPFQRAEQHFSSATSLALQRLEHDGTIQLPTDSDAEQWIIQDGQGARSVSRVVFLKGKS